ncbi:hypothetical protein PROVRUST_05921 [Providencia rustigianii DSM 4541]|uniref:Uncharacterized protein n=1 Tax=Providencia rustigianii DSM 4541 TaxID=500637 RepID=D1P0C4_9GAMM|nr:hypothetical protein PROVRUST_05921 [Providencia rustigianii DSM 4541]
MGADMQSSISQLCFLLLRFNKLWHGLLVCIKNLNGCSYNTLENK